MPGEPGTGNQGHDYQLGRGQFVTVNFPQFLINIDLSNNDYTNCLDLIHIIPITPSSYADIQILMNTQVIQIMVDKIR